MVISTGLVEYKEISGKEWYGGLVAKRVTAVSATLKNESCTLQRAGLEM